MRTKTTIFAIPTNRLRDVAETVEIYDRHFWSNGHSVKIMIFDDSTVGNHEKYYAKLEQTKTVNDLYYIGPREKEAFIRFLNRKLRTASSSLWFGICFDPAMVETETSP